MEDIPFAEVEANTTASSSVWENSVPDSVSIATTSSLNMNFSVKPGMVDEENVATFMLQSADGYQVSEDSVLGKIIYLLQSPHIITTPKKKVGGKLLEGFSMIEITKALQKTFGLSWSAWKHVHGSISIPY